MRFLARLFKKADSRSSTPKQVARSAAERLNDAFAAIQQIEIARINLANPGYGKQEEERIIWRELFDLEMQQLHEHFGRR